MNLEYKPVTHPVTLLDLIKAVMCPFHVCQYTIIYQYFKYQYRILEMYYPLVLAPAEGFGDPMDLIQ